MAYSEEPLSPLKLSLSLLEVAGVSLPCIHDPKMTVPNQFISHGGLRDSGARDAETWRV